MNKAMKVKIKEDKKVDLKEGQGFNDLHGCIPEIGPIPKHNGLNINNEPLGRREREIEKAKRR